MILIASKISDGTELQLFDHLLFLDFPFLEARFDSCCIFIPGTETHIMFLIGILG